MLNDQQRAEFHQRGYTTLPGLLEPQNVATMQSRLWSLLKVAGVDQNPGSWPKGDVHRLQAIRRGDPNPLDNSLLVSALDMLFGFDCWQPKTNWGQALVSFPTDGPWQPAAGPWHLDHPYLADAQISGINAFLFVDDVRPTGGGTLVLESSPGIVEGYLAAHPEHRGGSHGTLNRLLLKSDPWLTQLSQKGPRADSARVDMMQAVTTVFGQPAKLVELTGQAGDLVLCHPLLLHSPSMNSANWPRLMRVQRFHRKSPD